MHSKRKFLMLAGTYDANKHKIKGWLASEKLDGNRCFWDGGISRGLLKSQIPWANNAKDERYVEAPIATGLWTRYGNVFVAPDSFLDQLPPVPLDGELWSNRKSWQKLSKTIKTITPDQDAWALVKFHVFDIPEYASVFANGESTDKNFLKVFDLQACLNFVRSRTSYSPRFASFRTNQERLFELKESCKSVVQVMSQILVESAEHAEDMLKEYIEYGGEGIMFRDPKSFWEPKRSKCMLKWKPYNDAEGIVTGYTWGRETDKGSKLLGLMGALVLSYKGQRLELSGFTDPERVMTFHPFPGQNNPNTEEGYMFPGEQISRNWFNSSYPIGSTVTFRYRELSDTGIPKEASFDRTRMNF